MKTIIASIITIAFAGTGCCQLPKSEVTTTVDTIVTAPVDTVKSEQVKTDTTKTDTIK